MKTRSWPGKSGTSLFGLDQGMGSVEKKKIKPKRHREEDRDDRGRREEGSGMESPRGEVEAPW